jgi:hypothetical protein
MWKLGKSKDKGAGSSPSPSSNIFALNRLQTSAQSAYRRQGLADAKGATDKRSEVDPVVDKIRAMLDSSGMTDRDVARRAGLADSTVVNIRLGVTRQPKHRTVFSIAEACGFTYVFVPRSRSSLQGKNQGKDQGLSKGRSEGKSK